MNRNLSPALEKRIKRRVTARDHVFFAATAPHLEHLCLQELSHLSPPVKAVEILEGGVAFSGGITDCLQANLHLRTANRILMRIEAFKATNFRQLDKKLGAVEWELYLLPGSLLQIKVSTRRSRLRHTAAITAHVQASIDERFNQMGYGSLSDGSEGAENRIEQGIFVRAQDDRFTLSIDSSGEHLYKRGIKKKTGRAPLRETLAAAVLILAAYNGSEPLIDPMCGSGTFSLEAAMMEKRVPAGVFRDFAFMNWPCFRPAGWAYQKREAKKRIRPDFRAPIFASDQNQNACRALTENLSRFDIFKSIHVQAGDFFDIIPDELTNQRGLVAINPPYGLRIGGKQQSARFFSDICLKLNSDFKGWKFALIVPRRSWLKHVPFQYHSHPIYHGGLELSVLTGRI